MCEEFFAGKIFAPFARLGDEIAFDDSLRGDAGVVGSGDPEGLKAAHPLPADQDVLQGVDKGMAHMENAGDIGRRDDDAIGRFFRMGIGFEKMVPIPKSRAGLFDEFWVVGFRKFILHKGLILPASFVEGKGRK